jgi:hypothetical protein
MGEWEYSSTILDLSTRWRSVVGFMALSTLPQENRLISAGTHFIGGKVVPRSDVDTVEKRKMLSLPRIESPLSSQSPYRLNTTVIEITKNKKL